MAVEISGKKSFVVITGASRGIGRGFAVEFAKKVGPKSVILIIARNEVLLNETKSLMEQAAPEIDVKIGILDLNKPHKGNYLEAISGAVVANENVPSSYDHAIIIHNAASSGNVNLLLSQQDDVKFIQDHMNLNVITPILLNSVFLSIFQDPSKARTIIQISSMAGTAAIRCWGMYGCTKSARNMMMKCLPVEEQNVTALSYSPGIVDTAMYAEGETSTDGSVSKLFREAREMGKLITPEESAGRLIQVLEEGNFENGGYVDYYGSSEAYHPDYKS